MYQIITLPTKEKHQLIHDVILHPYQVNQDPRGTLIETLKTTWDDIYHSKKRPFTQMYFSTTAPAVARDVDKWHFHPGGQEDRFGVIAGDIIVAIYDNRDNSPTLGTLNLFAMGQSQGRQGQYMLLVPPRTYHGYVVVSSTPATMYNFPTRLYDPEEEKRLAFSEYRLSDDSVFSWDQVTKAYNEKSS